MDPTLVSRAAAVKRRQRRDLPTLWLFSDPVRLPDPRAALARLPGAARSPFAAGLVYRPAPDADPALGAALARLCRARAIALVVAGDARLAARLGAGLHRRGGRGPRAGIRKRGGWTTASAHGAAELRRARAAGADLVFLSAVFPTASHPGTTPLGPLRWARLAVRAGVAVAALGGVDIVTIRRLPRFCAGFGMIGAVLEAPPPPL